jgi:dihydrodipicolinate synthase/N-acetylneuraminate lyase
MTNSKRYPSVILGTGVIPWTPEWKFDEDLFRRQVRHLTATLTPHLYIFGTAGEGYAVTDSQFEWISRVFLEEMGAAGGEATLGIITLSLPTLLERIEKGRSWGCRRFQISLPSWGELGDEEVDVFFAETCGRFTDCSFMHYNLMRTKRLLTGTEYGRLAERYPNLIATKNTRDDEDFLVELLEKAPTLQHFLGEFGYARMRDRHECGLLISLASTHPARASQFLAARGKALQQMAVELRSCLSALIGAVGGRTYMDGVYDKLIYKLQCPSFPLRMLPPYASVGEDVFESYRQRLQEDVPAWMPDPHDQTCH